MPRIRHDSRQGYDDLRQYFSTKTEAINVRLLVDVQYLFSSTITAFCLMLTSLFTLPDPELSQDSSVDPMGISAIWTTYGQAIFKDRLTTIANDARIFTINVFHHAVLKSLFEEYSEEVEAALKQYSEWKTEFEMKSGLLIWMEDTSTIAFSDDYDRSIEVEKFGVLGLSKWRSVKNNGDPQGYILRASRAHGILKKQIVLGMSGRYKNPLIEMGFFDRFYRYDHPRNIETWKQCEPWLQAWQSARQLHALLVNYVRHHILTRRTKGHPSAPLRHLENEQSFQELLAAYRNAFGKRALHPLAQAFWLDQLGIRRGAGMAVYRSLKTHGADAGPIPYERVFAHAIPFVADEPEEKAKLISILEVGPFLSHGEFALRYLAQRSMKRLEDHRVELEQMRILWRDSIVFAPNSSLPRLQQLVQIANVSGDLREWVKALFDFHASIMQARGGNAWVQLNADNTLHHFYAPSLPASYNTINLYKERKPWLHSYYLDSLKFIQNSL